MERARRQRLLGASQAQYLQMWSRSYARVRAAFPDQLIVGPSIAGQPTSSSSWWTTYLDYVKANNVAPDISAGTTMPADPVPMSRAPTPPSPPRG